MASFYDQVYVGTSDGRVCLVDPHAAQGVMLEHRLGTGRPVSQVLVMGELGLLLALSGGGVEAVDAQRMTARPGFKAPLKAEVLCMATTSERAPDFALCLATSHKLHLLRWAGERHEPWKTLNVTSPPSSLAWCRGTVCAALEDQVVLVDVAGGTSRKVHSFAPAPASPGGGSGQGLGAGGAKVLAVAGGRFLMCIESLGIVITAGGEPSGSALVWSSPPREVATINGLVVTVHAAVGSTQTLEARTLDGAIAESLKLAAPAVAIAAPQAWNSIRAPAPGDDALKDLDAGGGVLLLCPPLGQGAVVRVGTVSLGQRVDEMLAEGDVEGAARLFLQRWSPAVAASGAADKSSNAKWAVLLSGTTRAEAEAAFRAYAGIAMLRRDRPDLAFAQWARAGPLDPRELLAHMDRLRDPEAPVFEPRVLRADVVFPGAAQSQGTGAAKEDCRLLSVVARPKGDSGRRLYEAFKDYLWRVRGGCRDEVGATADLALFRVLLLLDEGVSHAAARFRAELERLCEGPNCLRAEAVPTLAAELRSRGCHHAAALLLASVPALRRAALELWADMGSGRCHEEGRDGVEETVRFLARSHGDPELVWVFSAWALGQAPARAVRIFTREHVGKERAAGVVEQSPPPPLQQQQEQQPRLSPDKVLGHLEPFDKDRRHRLRLIYLESLCRDSSTAARALDLQLAYEYVATLDALCSASPAQREAVRAAFSDFVAREETLRGTVPAAAGDAAAASTSEAEAVVRRIEQTAAVGSLARHEVALYRKCGLHARALELLVMQLADTAAAEEYCLGNQGDQVDPFLDLLCIYFRPENAQRYREPMLLVLERHGHRIDATAVVARLPADLPIADLQLYLGLVLARNTRRLCQLRVEKNLHVALNIKTRSKLVRRHRRNVSITADTRCAQCQRPIATQPFVLDPSCLKAFHETCAEQLRSQLGSASGQLQSQLGAANEQA
jgi:hypothetical protein